MNAGLFASSCPECGGALATDPSGVASTCPPCQRAYLNRFGHLIPIDLREPEPEQAVLPARLG